MRPDASTRLPMRDTQGAEAGAVADVGGPGPGEEPKDGRDCFRPINLLHQSPVAHKVKIVMQVPLKNKYSL